MKFRCEREILADALTTAGRAATSRTGTLPVLSGVRLDVVDGELTVTGTDLELTIRLSVPVHSDRDGSAVVPARRDTMMTTRPDTALRIVVRSATYIIIVRPEAPPASPNDPLEPFIDRVSGGQVVGYLETHSSGNAPRPDAVRLHITRSASNDTVATGRSSVSVRDGGWAMARTLVPIGKLPPGSYVAHAEILADGAVVARTARPFTIVR